MPFDIARNESLAQDQTLVAMISLLLSLLIVLLESLSSPEFRCRCHWRFVSYRSMRPFLFLTLVVIRNELNGKTTGLATKVDVDAASDFCESHTTRAGHKLHKSF